MKKYDRFDLETEIQNAWQTRDDLESIAERIYDDPDGPMEEEDVVTVLSGLSELHETRMKKLWRVFDTMVKENCFDATPPKSGYIHPQYKDDLTPAENYFKQKEERFQKNSNINSGFGPQTHVSSEEESFFRGNTSPLK